MFTVRMRRTLLVALICVAAFSAVSCGSDHLTVSLTGDSPPRFTLDGPGRWAECCNSIEEFKVMEVTPDDPIPWDKYLDDNQNPHLMWRIEPVDAPIYISDAPPIIPYGQVPQGWRQTYPSSGHPRQLLEGHRYMAGQPHTSEDGTLVFVLKSGKGVSTN
jgi:hypothetical protein